MQSHLLSAAMSSWLGTSQNRHGPVRVWQHQQEKQLDRKKGSRPRRTHGRRSIFASNQAEIAFLVHKVGFTAINTQEKYGKMCRKRVTEAHQPSTGSRRSALVPFGPFLKSGDSVRRNGKGRSHVQASQTPGRVCLVQRPWACVFLGY